MKARLFVSLAVWILLGSVPARAVQPGDSRAAALDEFGTPEGRVAARDVEVLYFPRAEVRLRAGVVTTVHVASETEVAARAAAEQARADRRARLETEGRELLENRKNDPAFAQLSATAQLDYWRNFAARYPMISVDAEIAALRDRFDQEQAQREEARARELRLATLEARVAEAEARAARAEAEARLARNRGGYVGWGFGGDHRPRRHDPPAEVTPREPFPLTPRGQAMGAYEEARAAIYRRAEY